MKSFKQPLTSAVLGAALALSFTTTALAEGEDTFMAPQGDYQGQPAQQEPVAQEEPTAEEGRGVEYGAHLFFPIWLTTENYEQGFGIGINGRGGWEFGSGFTAEINIGFLYTALDINPGVEPTDGNVAGFHIGAGIRYSLLNPTAIVPFGGAGLAIDLYNVKLSSDLTETDSGASLELNATLGVAFEVSAKVAIEAGAQFHVLLPITGDSEFERNGLDATQMYVSPFIGATLYYN